MKEPVVCNPCISRPEIIY